MLNELDKIVSSASSTLSPFAATMLSFVTKYVASLIFYLLTIVLAPWVLRRSAQFERRHLKSEEQVLYFRLCNHLFSFIRLTCVCDADRNRSFTSRHYSIFSI